MSAATTLDPPSKPRSPWQKLYSAAHAARRKWYLERADRLPCTVISIGNLHWGGTGKTPLVSAIARHLSDAGLYVTILSRGYKRRGRNIRIVSTGDGPLLGPRVAGDEPVLLAGELPGVSVVVGPDRYQAGVHALERLPRQPDVFLLEDGFSHLRLFRDLDLLTFPASDPFGGGKLFPSGSLREPLASSRWADAAVLTASEGTSGAALAACLQPFGFQGRGFSARAVVGGAIVERGELLQPGARVVVVTGIARPERVHASLAELPYDVVGSIDFPDHHDYPSTSLREITRRVQAARADWVLTTAKDHVKLLGRLEAPLAMLPLRAEPEPALWEWLDDRMRDLDQISARNRS
jgi:tetraacyldisaccharide 4'-kinase